MKKNKLYTVMKKRSIFTLNYESLGWYKDNLNICCEKFKRYHEINFDPNHDKRLPFIDMTSFGHKRRSQIQVVKNEENE